MTSVNGEGYLTHLIRRLVERHHELRLQVVMSEPRDHLGKREPCPVALGPSAVFSLLDFALFVRSGIFDNHRWVIVVRRSQLGCEIANIFEDAFSKKQIASAACGITKTLLCKEIVFEDVGNIWPRGIPLALLR